MYYQLFCLMMMMSLIVVEVTAFLSPKLPLQNYDAARVLPRQHVGGALFSSDSSVDAVSMTSTAATESSPIDFVQNLLLQLSSSSSSSPGNKGQILVDASSEKWRQAIYQAIGAPVQHPDSSSKVDTTVVAKSLQDKMSRPDSQFAILMGDASQLPYTVAFPSDIVDYKNDGTVWLECQLRHTDTNKLFVIMGINLVVDTESSQWKILSLDWQDFREQFYPGLSGREWLRAY